MTLAEYTTIPTTQMDRSELSINTLRTLAMDAVQAANSGHPGMPMGAAAMAYVLWRKHMVQDPATPDWSNRDRFILSAGHGSMLLYGLLHLAGYPLSIDDLKSFRQSDSLTPGHPEFGHTVGVETTTGPLGQGFANGVGMAVAEQFLAGHFNRPDHEIVDHFTYAIVSDGDLMEGISHEAASIAGHQKLGKLIYLYDDNHVTIDGNTDIAFTEDVQNRFESYGWQVLRVEDGNDVEQIDTAITAARDDSNRPSLIMVRTIIGFGSPNKANSSSSHGAPLGEDEIRVTKERLGWTASEKFHVPESVAEHMGGIATEGVAAREAWDDSFSAYASVYPELASEYNSWMMGETPEGWASVLPEFEPGPGLATRSASGKCINALAPVLGNLFGGSADLAGSNNSRINESEDFDPATRSGRNFNFGVREHAMASMCNGMRLHGGIRPYCATFLIFSDYMRPAIRLSALMGIGVTYVFTHDSIGLGQDGPTHQPVEQLMTLRAIPNCTVIRPADSTETAAAWKLAIENTTGPVLLALSRQKLNNMDPSEHVGDATRGAYIVRKSAEEPDVILIATGSEVNLALESAKALASEDVNATVVSMPSWSVFDSQDAAYRELILPERVTARVSIEAGITMGWERYIGSHGASVGIDSFGASAPAEELFEKFGFTVANVVSKVRSVL